MAHVDVLSYQHLPPAVLLCLSLAPGAGIPGLSWAQRCLSFQESAPFAVIGSNTVVEAKGQRVRGRLYPWGIVEGKQGAWEHWEEGQGQIGIPAGMAGDCLCHLWHKMG